jgi:hypothetical protein
MCDATSGVQLGFTATIDSGFDGITVNRKGFAINSQKEPQVLNLSARQ